MRLASFVDHERVVIVIRIIDVGIVVIVRVHCERRIDGVVLISLLARGTICYRSC